MLIIDNIEYRSGDLVLFKIDNVSVPGVLHIEGSGEGAQYYVCHNDANFNGNKSPDKHGYEYSWAFSYISKVLTDGVKIEGLMGRPKEGFNIDSELSKFLNISSLSNLISIISFEKVLKDYNCFSKSDTKGLISMSNSKNNKKVEIKFGRFLKSICKEYPVVSFSDKEIEDKHNLYLLFQQGNYIKTIKDIKGLDILKYYKRDRQLSKVGSKLYNSCMNDKEEAFLKIYTDNKNISLIAVEQLNLVVGRALVWTLPNGNKVIDKRYTSHDWVDTQFKSIIEEDNLIDWADLDMDIEIELDNVEYDYYPYVDTFRYLDKENKKLSNTLRNRSNKYILSRTDGSYDR